MDISRPDLKRRQTRRRVILITGGLIFIAAITCGLALMEPSAPGVDQEFVWTDTVKRGDMLRQVRGNGILVSERIVFIQAETDGRIERIHILPGAQVDPDTILMELSNPDLEQTVFDLEWQIRAAEAAMKQLEVQLESDRLTQESQIASMNSDFNLAEIEAQADETLADSGLIPDLTRKRSRTAADQLKAKLEIEEKKLIHSSVSAEAQLAVKNADLEKLRALLQLKKGHLEGLQVRAGIHGVLQEIGDNKQLQIGQRISASATLAKVVQPEKLKAEIRISETQARDIQIGQKAEIDTRNGLIPGIVSRVDPAVQNGTVTVDVTLNGKLPKGARPDLSVDGTIELQRLSDILYLNRPINSRPESLFSLFRLNDRGDGQRISVEFGRGSVTTIEIRKGLDEGDEVILSDMSRYDEFDRIRLK